jgi:hypothetical protein
MARIEVPDAQAWVEKTKLDFTNLDPGLLEQIESQVVGRLAGQFDTSTWTDHTTTPKMVKSVIAMFFVAWFYDRTYSEDQEQGNDYAAMLRAQAEALLVGILDGSTVLPEVPGDNEPSGPSFYPNDESSALCPTDEDPSLGPAVFSIGFRF